MSDKSLHHSESKLFLESLINDLSIMTPPKHQFAMLYTQYHKEIPTEKASLQSFMGEIQLIQSSIVERFRERLGHADRLTRGLIRNSLWPKGRWSLEEISCHTANYQDQDIGVSILHMEPPGFGIRNPYLFICPIGLIPNGFRYKSIYCILPKVKKTCFLIL